MESTLVSFWHALTRWPYGLLSLLTQWPDELFTLLGFFFVYLLLRFNSFTHSQHLAAVERCFGLVVDNAVTTYDVVLVLLPVDVDAQFLPQFLQHPFHFLFLRLIVWSAVLMPQPRQSQCLSLFTVGLCNGLALLYWDLLLKTLLAMFPARRDRFAW